MRQQKIWKRMTAAVMAAALVVTLASAQGAQAKKKGTVKSVTITNKELGKKLTLKKGKTYTLKVKVKTTGKISKKVVFKSSKKSVAAVSAKGKITAKKKGKATITVYSKADKKKKATLKVVVKNPTAPAPTAEPASADKTGYTEMWRDDFNSTELNRDDWNVELHEAGWVNSEQQEYVDSKENIYIKDGALILKPVKKTDASGNVTYTSGRVNTQGKHDFKYGLFEARVKVPKGQGYLPAFWMMPTDENLYGQWPKCGEIDGMEVMGQETDKVYGTIHYGEPHKETQGTYTLGEDVKDFSDDYHVFDVEWEPGKITWYVDGVKYHEADDWYSAVEGKGTKTYPAPFDQPFYMILNLAVGGSWVGMTDETTDFENAEFVIDYVRAYQKDSYDENVKRPVAADVTLREPDAAGNYIVNGDFAAAEALDDDMDWIFMTQQNGEAEAAIADKTATIKTTNAGEVDYSIQLVQGNLPMKKNAGYTLSFDAKASEARSMKVAIQGPDQGWIAYMDGKTVDLTTEKQTFTYDFTVRADSDPNARLDFNMGAFGSTADIEISNVVLIKTSDNVPEGAKTVRADGNYIYNGEFDEGDNRLGYWEIADADKANVSVTNEENVRRLKVTAPDGTTEGNPLVISQSDLGLTAAGKYALSYMAYKEGAAAGDKSLIVTFAGQSFETALTAEEKIYTEKLELASGIAQADADFALKFTAPGTYYVDDVRIEEDALVKNGSFHAGMSGFTQYTYEAAKSDYTIDSLSEDNAFAITINDTGDADWHVQLYQDGVSLEKGKFYRLIFKAKSTLDRYITCAIQHNGSADDNWTPYFDTLKAGLTSEYQTFKVDFEMKNDSDPVARLGFALGKIDDKITTQHSIFIDDISLEEIDEKDADIAKVEVPDVKAGENLLKNVSFANNAEGWNAYAAKAEDKITLKDGVATFELTNVGEADYSVALQQDDLVLEKDAKYKLTFKASSTAARTINVALQSPDGSSWYGGNGALALTSEMKEQTIEFTPVNVTDAAAAGVRLNFALGKITDWSTGSAVTKDTPASTIVISDISLVKTE